MDNDSRLIKKVKQTIKNTKFSWSYKGIRIADENEGNEIISQMIISGKPFCAVRGGATELRCIAEYLNNEGQFSEKIKSEISNLSGFFLQTRIVLSVFVSYIWSA